MSTACLELPQGNKTGVKVAKVAPPSAGAAGRRLRQIHFQDRHVEGIRDFAVFLILEQDADEFAIKWTSTESCCLGRSTMVMVSRRNRLRRYFSRRQISLRVMLSSCNAGFDVA